MPLTCGSSVSHEPQQSRAEGRRQWQRWPLTYRTETIPATRVLYALDDAAMGLGAENTTAGMERVTEKGPYHGPLRLRCGPVYARGFL